MKDSDGEALMSKLNTIVKQNAGIWHLTHGPCPQQVNKCWKRRTLKKKKEIKDQTQAQLLQEVAQVAHGMKQREAVPVLNYIIEKIKTY